MESGNKNCLCEALCDVIALQDLISDYQSKYFGQCLVEIMGGDTIPLLLLKNKGDLLSLLDKTMQFETVFFRIESLDKESCCMTLLLLRGIDYEGHYTNSLVDVVNLEKTTTKRMIELCGIVAIQRLHPDLLKNNIIIEPKW